MQTVKIEEGIFEVVASRVVDADQIHADLSFMEHEGMLTFGDQTTRILSDEFKREGYAIDLTDLCYEDDLSIGLQMPDTWYLNRGLYGVSISMYFNFLNYKEMAKDGELYTRNLTVAESFTNTGDKHFNVLQFWQYGFSSLNSNVLRGPLAEFLVENALRDAKDIGIRNPWGDSDVEHQHTNIEVKSSSYLQDWDQNNLTAIRWTGLKAKKIFWNGAVAKQSTDDADYKSDVYVLALFKHQDHSTLDILDMDQWCFYVLSKDQLREVSGDKSSVSLSCLEKKGVEPVLFSNLRNAICAL